MPGVAWECEEVLHESRRVCISLYEVLYRSEKVPGEAAKVRECEGQ